MMKRVQKPNRGTPSRSFKPQQSRFAPRPFPACQPEQEATSGEPLFSYNLRDIPVYPREPVQPKLSLGPVGDRYEQEANRMAGQVVSTISSPEQNSVQRQEDLEDEDELDMEEDGGLQRKVDGIGSTGGAGVKPDLESSIQRARGSGQPLTDGVRQPMEKAFGANFGRMRLHTDGQADRVNRSIQARAFTTGQDLFFRQGEYRPGGFEGQRLLAHELTHVVQQNRCIVQRTQKQAPGRAIQRAPVPEFQGLCPRPVGTAIPTHDGRRIKPAWLRGAENAAITMRTRLASSLRPQQEVNGQNFYRCPLCGKLGDLNGMGVDHRIPWEEWPGCANATDLQELEAAFHDLDNLQLVHTNCNSSKGVSDLLDWWRGNHANRYMDADTLNKVKSALERIFNEYGIDWLYEVPEQGRCQFINGIIRQAIGNNVFDHLMGNAMIKSAVGGW